MEFCDEISSIFRDLSKILNLTNTDFIRTTEKRHIKSVQHLWEILEKNDDILDYLGKNNKSRPKIVVGFSAETENVIQNSKLKTYIL